MAIIYPTSWSLLAWTEIIPFLSLKAAFNISRGFWLSSSTFATSWSPELASDCPELSRNFSANPKTIATKTSETVYTRPEQYTSISGVPCWKSERIWRHSNCKKSGFERRETKVFNVKKDWNVILHCSMFCRVHQTMKEKRFFCEICLKTLLYRSIHLKRERTPFCVNCEREKEEKMKKEESLKEWNVILNCNRDIPQSKQKFLLESKSCSKSWSGNLSLFFLFLFL